MKKQILFIILFIIWICNIPLNAKYWEKVKNLPSSANLVQWLDVYFLNPTNGWICGRSYSDYLGRVARTTDGGATWNVSTLPGWFLESVHFIDTEYGFCSGPDGIFKSTDGGATWTSITYINNLVYNGDIDIWGCFMLNRDTIFVAGGGCLPADTHSIKNNRIIWRTTDGGATWTPNSLSFIPLNGSTNYYSGLTDIIVYSSGIGYASSSGLIWKTTNFGDTWNILSQTSNILSWQEEITHYNNSILVPYSGNDCAGGAQDGGMRFSINIDHPYPTWRNYTTHYPMYGAFLLSSSEGWVCGTNKGIYHTNDSGITWKLKNCGIEDYDNLDDMFFIGPDFGWVVGDNIYKLNNSSKMLVNKDTVDFGDSCTIATVYDTVTVKNMNFESSTLDISILENNEFYSIIKPDYLYFPVPACNETKIIVKYAPKEVGEHYFSIIIKLHPYDEQITHIDTIYYKGALKEFTTYADQDTIDFGDVFVKTNSYRTLKWFSESGDTIIGYKCSTNNLDFTNISASTKIPFTVHPNDTNNKMEFKISPRDTGIAYVTYTFTFSPCNETKTIVLKVNGVSPIINVKKEYNINIICKNDTTIKIPIENIGTYDLEVYKVSIQDSNELNPITLNRQVKILGLSNNKSLPTTIKPKSTDTLLLYLYSNDLDTLSGELLITSNDTKRITSEAPKRIKFNAIFKKNKLNNNILEFNFGYICVGNSITLMKEIENLGNQKFDLTNIIEQDVLKGFDVKQAPKYLDPAQKSNYIISFTPYKVGLFKDTIIVTLTPCNDTLKLVLNGQGVTNDVTIEPKEINDLLNINILKEYNITLTSNSVQTIRIDSAIIEPNVQNAKIELLNTFPIYLSPSGKKVLSFQAISDTEFTYKGNILVYLKSECTDTLNIPILIDFVNNNLEYTDIKGDPVHTFSHYTTCENSIIYDTIYVTNTQPYTFVSLNFTKNEPEYNILECPNLPLKINQVEKIRIIVSYNNIDDKEGNFNNSIIFEMLNDNTQETRFDTIYFQNEFRKSNTIINEKSINFDISENCDSAIIKHLEIINNGTLEDTLFIASSDIPDYYEFNKDTIIIKPLSKELLDIIFTPSKVIDLPNYNTTKLILKNKVCPKSFDVTLYSITDSIKITISDKIINFGEVWKNHQKTMEVEITNSSLFDVYLTTFNIQPNIYFTSNVILPLLIQKNSSEKIYISFSGPETNIYDGKILLNIERSCNVNDSITLSATVPIEKYIIPIKFDTTKAIPGNTAIISAFITDTVSSEINAQAIDFTIDMDNLLFYPEKLYIIYNNIKEEIEFNFSINDGIKGSINSNIAQTILNNRNKFLEIHGIALLSYPNETPIRFKNFDILTDKICEITQEEGKFNIYGYCGNTNVYNKINNYHIETIINEIIFKDELKIKFISDTSTKVTIKLFNTIGKLVLTQDVQLTKGNNEINFPVSYLSNGSYNIKIINNSNIIKTKNLIIMR